MFSRQSIVIILWTTLSSSVTASIINTHPPNIRVEIGQPVVFPLTYSNCNWERLLNGDLIPIYKSSDKVPTSPRYLVNETEAGQCDLTINNVSFSDAGIYQYANGDHYGLELFVIDRNPFCFVRQDGMDSDSEEDNITLRCSLSYSNKDRKLFPTLKWQPLFTTNDKSMHSGVERTDQYDNYSTITSLFRVPYTTQVEHVSCFAQLAGTPTSSSDQKMAQNRVTFDGHCEIGQTEISPRNIKITNEMNMRVGDTINCSARGYPEVHYYWTKDDIRVGENPVLILDTEGLHTYKCFAYNVIQGHQKVVHVEKLFLIHRDTEVKDNLTHERIVSVENKILMHQAEEVIDNTARTLSGLALGILIAILLGIIIRYLWLNFGNNIRKHVCCCPKKINGEHAVYNGDNYTCMPPIPTSPRPTAASDTQVEVMYVNKNDNDVNENNRPNTLCNTDAQTKET